MAYFTFLVASLFGFWLLLSGFWDNGLLLALGAISTMISAYLGWQIEKRNPRQFSLKIIFRLPRYLAWLLVEIFKSNIDVTKRIWMPAKHPISPTLAQIPCTQKTRMGRTVFANSITLTPGTVAIEMSETNILVHALTEEAAKDLQRGKMDAWVTRTEGIPR